MRGLVLGMALAAASGCTSHGPARLCADGLARQRRQDYSGAVRQYDAALAVAPGNLEALFGRGVSLMRLGDQAQAIQAFDAVVAGDPTHANALLHRGISRWASGDRTGAKEDLMAAVRAGSASEVESVARDLLDLVESGESLSIQRGQWVLTSPDGQRRVVRGEQRDDKTHQGVRDGRGAPSP